ncbi:MAG: elongation factor Ts [Myxococcales bacterium]|nr:elongation factor Ts [Myxococcales bacterium]
MSVQASQVKALREATGAGMMDCKKALVETNGDFEEAKIYLQKKGIADSKKRSAKSASEGRCVTFISSDNRHGLLLEVNCETDFVARNEDFGSFVEGLAELAHKTNAASVGDLLAADWDGEKVETKVQEQSGKTGEKLVVRRLARLDVPEGKSGYLADYIHDGGKIGVLVALNLASDADASSDAVGTLTRDIAMHVAATDPTVVSGDDLDPDAVAREKAILVAQAAESGKPADIVEKMVVGRLNKWKKEVALLSQPFVKDQDVTVEKHVAAVSKSLSGAAGVRGFVRFLLGDGVEPSTEE